MRSICISIVATLVLAGTASADVTVTGVMSGGASGNHSNGVSWQFITDVDINGSSHNVFRLYADRNWMDAQNGLTNEIMHVQGTWETPSTVITNGLIYKDAFAPGDGPSTEEFNGLFGNIRYTSYTTIGAETQSPHSAYLNDQGWHSNGFNMVGASFAALPFYGLGLTNNDTAATGNGNTLLMQITTTGDELAYDLHIQSSVDGMGIPWWADGTVAIHEAEDCPADADGNGNVDVIDLLAVIDGWGTENNDLNGDGTTDVLDLLAVIDGWGICD